MIRYSFYSNSFLHKLSFLPHLSSSMAFLIPLLWYHSSSIEELCCATLSFIFLSFVCWWADEGWATNWLKCLMEANLCCKSEIRRKSPCEYRALASATYELQWLTHFLDDFGIVYTRPTLLFCDNCSALHITANPDFHECTKHIEIDCHIMREKLRSGLIKLLPIAST